MAWIESHTVLIRHRKVAALATALRLRRSYVIGHLHALWHAALEQQDDGDLSAWSDEFIAESSDFPGDAPQYVRLLQEVGWLDGKLLHDWPDYAGTFLRNRYASGNRDKLVEIWRKHGRTYGVEGKGLRKETGNLEATNKSPTSNQQVTNHTLPDLTRPNQTNTNPIASGDAGAGDDPPAVNASGRSPPKKKHSPRKPADGEHPALVAAFCAAWRDHHGKPYVVNGGRDGKAAKALLAAVGLEEAKRIVRAYVNDDDPWLEHQAHPLFLLGDRINRYRAEHYDGPPLGLSGAEAEALCDRIYGKVQPSGTTAGNYESEAKP